MSIYLALKTINLQTVRHHELPDCYDFHITVGDDAWKMPRPRPSCWDIVADENIHADTSFNLPLTKLFFLRIQILFDNRAHSGKIKVDVENDVRIYECRDWNVEGTCKFEPKVIFISTVHTPVNATTDLESVALVSS